MRQLNTSFWDAMQPTADAIEREAARAICLDFFEDLQLGELSCVQTARGAPPPIRLSPSLQLKTDDARGKAGWTHSTRARAQRGSSGFEARNGSFWLHGVRVRLFAGSLQHFRIHPDHWEHRLLLAKARPPDQSASWSAARALLMP